MHSILPELEYVPLGQSRHDDFDGSGIVTGGHVSHPDWPIFF